MNKSTITKQNIDSILKSALENVGYNLRQEQQTISRTASIGTVGTAETQLSARHLLITNETMNVLMFPDTLGAVLSFIPSGKLLPLIWTSKLFRVMINASNRIFLRCTISNLLNLSSGTQALVSSNPNANNEQSLEPRSLDIKLIEVSTARDVQNIINFINNPLNEPFLNRIESISLGDISGMNIVQVQELLNLLTEQAGKFPKLTSISFGHILADFELPKLPAHLTSLSFKNICGGLILSELPAGLAYLSVGFMWGNLKLDGLPANLTSLSFSSVNTNFSIPKFPANLVCLYLGDIVGPLTLSEFSDNLLFLGIGDVLGPLTINKIPDSLISLSFADIYDDARIILAEPSENLTYFSYGTVNESPQTEQMLQDFRAKIEKKVSEKEIV